MKSAFECYQQAAKCQEMASAAADANDRAVLLATAEHWRTLGNKARAAEKAVPPKASG